MMAEVRSLSLLLLVAAASLWLGDAAIYVNSNAPATSTQAGTQANPCLSLSCGLRLAVSEETVLVASGDYIGADNCNLNGTAGLKNVKILGQGPTASVVIRSTVPTTRAFVIHGGSVSLLQNLTIRDFSYHPVSSYQSKSRSYIGGAISVSVSNVTLAGVAMLNNSAVEGGALGASHGSRVTLLGCRFLGNRALSGGGALSIDLSSLNASHSSFELNTALGNPQAQTFGDGGAILAFAGVDGKVTLSHVIFRNNSAAEAGGAVHVQSINFAESSFVVEYSDFFFNAVTGAGRCLSSTLCSVRGGAMYSSVPSSLLSQLRFTANAAATSAVNQVAEGGAVYATSIFSDTASSLTTQILGCSFTGNYASGSGGGAYLLNQQISMLDCQLSGNVAGTKGSLFSDASTSGGALWYSAPKSQSLLQRVVFAGNYVWGGWGGAIFGTDSPAPLRIVDCDFLGNTAFSSYTFIAQGGAVMISHNSIAVVESSRFVNNTASPRADISEGPFSLSGSGGAVYVHSANITLSSCNFSSNFALTGQFDSGSTGGAVLIEDSSASVVQHCSFVDNGAAGYLGYSSYASSGSAGALIVKFSSAVVKHCNFTDNWVSVGGTQLSSGGALAVFFDYTKPGSGGQGVQVQDTIFAGNTAFGQICSNSGTAGQGGAVAVIGSSRPGVTMARVNFTDNAAVSRTGFVLSFGGAVAVAVASNVSGTHCRFQRNAALYGLGNDVSAVAGESDYKSDVTFRDSVFAAPTGIEVLQLRRRVTLRQVLLCAALNRVIARAVPSQRKLGDDLEENMSATRRELPAWLSSQWRREQELEREWEAQGRPSESSPRAAAKIERSLSLMRSSPPTSAEVAPEEWDSESAALGGSRKDGGVPAFYHYPSVVITSGTAALINPTFEGEYHVFLGDMLSLVYGDSSPTGGSCSASIHGIIKQTSLTLTIFQASLTVANYVDDGLNLRKLTLMNGTLFVGNNVTVTGNSSIISSTISGMLDFSKLQGAPLAWRLANRHPTLRFRADLFTGFNLVDLQVLQNFNPQTALSLLAFPPSITIDGCLLKIYKSFEVDTPRQRSSGLAPRNGTIKIYMTNKALLNVTAGATLNIKTTTVVTAASSSAPALVNMGTIVLDGSRGTVQTGDDAGSDDRVVERTTKDASSLAATLTVMGQYEQGPRARLVVTLNSTGQVLPVLSLVSNASLLGTIAVNFLPDPEIVLYDGTPSSWALVSYSEAHVPASPGSAAQLSAPSGLGFAKKSHRAASSGGWTDSYVVDAMACGDVVGYYAGVQASSATLYPCFVCLSNSSCSYCGNHKCMDKSQQCSGGGGGTVLYESSCCADNCNAPNGKCVGSTDHTQFVCSCSPFYTGDTCKALSNISIVLITLAGALVVVMGILFYSYRSTLGRKTQVLEELRQGLLYGDGGLDMTQGDRRTAINEAYLQQLQQGLILKDVSVRWKEIEIEKQVGEGSFGVVYKAVFRGASVAVKKMRPQFSQLTPRDIDEFNKEAYMMSRLRHPNIVLVMGISFVDQEILPMPRRSSIADQRDGFAEEPEAAAASAGKHLPKTVCIVTEFLEQGSLADILYGPRRLPAEIWTYDLILTCALQAARGMLYLHTHSPPICHRDLKSSNLVVDDHWVVKVTDFGMSRILPEKIRDQTLEKLAQPVPAADRAFAPQRSPDRGANAESDRDSLMSHGSINTDVSQHSVQGLAGAVRGGAAAGPEMTSNLGTTAWCAPELLTASSTTRYSVKVDVYSFGMVLWELWEKKRPFDDLRNRFDIMDAIRAGRRPIIGEGCPPAYRSLVQRCWQAEPGRRPNFQYIVRYLKDELARVKRQRERQISSTSGPDGPYGLLGRDASNSVDSPPGKGGYAGTNLSQLLPWNRTGREEQRPSPGPQFALPMADAISAEYFQQHGVGAPNLAFLAASPALGSPFMRQSMLGPNPIAVQQQGANAGGNGNGNGNGFGAGYGNANAPLASASPRNSSSSASAAAAGPPNQWRDKYVMKFSGWKASQPDSGLPPSSMSSPAFVSNTSPPNGRLSISGAAPPVPQTQSAQGQPLTQRLSNNAMLVEDQHGLFNLDGEQNSEGSYTPPNLLAGDGAASPIIRVNNSGSGSGRWSHTRDEDQLSPVHASSSPQPRRSHSRGSNSF